MIDTEMQKNNTNEIENSIKLKVKDFFKNNPHQTKWSKKHNNFMCSFIKIEDKIYAIKEHLSSGNYGKIKYIQEIDTNSKFVLKVCAANNETKMLKQKAQYEFVKQNYPELYHGFFQRNAAEKQQITIKPDIANLCDDGDDNLALVHNNYQTPPQTPPQTPFKQAYNQTPPQTPYREALYQIFPQTTPQKTQQNFINGSPQMPSKKSQLVFSSPQTPEEHVNFNKLFFHDDVDIVTNKSHKTSAILPVSPIMPFTSFVKPTFLPNQPDTPCKGHSKRGKPRNPTKFSLCDAIKKIKENSGDFEENSGDFERNLIDDSINKLQENSVQGGDIGSKVNGLDFFSSSSSSIAPSAPSNRKYWVKKPGEPKGLPEKYEFKCGFIMSYIDGKTLDEFNLSLNKFSFKLKLTLFVSIFEELKQLHENKRIIHNDLNLNNILIKYDENDEVNPFKITFIDYDFAKKLPDGKLVIITETGIGDYQSDTLAVAPEQYLITPESAEQLVKKYREHPLCSDVSDLLKTYGSTCGFSSCLSDIYRLGRALLNSSFQTSCEAEEYSFFTSLLEGMTKHEPFDRLSSEDIINQCKHELLKLAKDKIVSTSSQKKMIRRSLNK